MVFRQKLTFLGLAALFASIFFVPMALGQDTTVKVRATWGPPESSEGTDPVLYRVEIRFRANLEAPRGFWGEVGTTPDLTYVLTFDKSKCYEVRVRAQDEAGHLGPYSAVSGEICIPGDQTGESETAVDPLPPETITGPIRQDG